MKPFLVYDCEIIKGILGKNERPVEGVEYCAGWRDFPNMGISVIGAYDYWDDRYRVFCDDNFDEFKVLAAERSPVSFNGIAFDDQLCRANGIPVTTEYDLLVETWAAAGLGPEFRYPSHTGYGLDAICEFNALGRKTGNGALAPVLWQQGKHGQVIDYCLQDVRLTVRLLDLVLSRGAITCPKTNVTLTMRRPVCD